MFLRLKDAMIMSCRLATNPAQSMGRTIDYEAMKRNPRNIQKSVTKQPARQAPRRASHLRVLAPPHLGCPINRLRG
jgi:hypothetical protein